MWQNLQNKLQKIYSEDESADLTKDIKKEIEKFKKRLSAPKDKGLNIPSRLTQKDIALITYPNTITEKGGVKTLITLKKFISKYQIDETINTIHILPFYPWDTDRGFSTTNEHEVDPEFGDWENIASLANSLKLMFDFSANHLSMENPLIQGALIERHLDRGDKRHAKYKKYKDFVIAYNNKEKPSNNNLKKLARPRPHPVLTKYTVVENEKGNLKAILGDLTKNETPQRPMGTGAWGWVWTTFSRARNPDGSEGTRQVDLNYKNPKVFLEKIKILLLYITHGATLIRLDAVAYLWKKLGSTSIHEPETHLILEILHDILKIAAPKVVTIAEVNEPQDKVYAYLGKKNHEESDLIYQFTHFPLAVYAILTEDGQPYMSWLKTLPKFEGKQFITVLGTHDGMGLKSLHNFLTQSQINQLTNLLTNKHNALPNYAHLPGGKKIIYEICSTPWNLINISRSKETLSLQVDRYLAVLALGLMNRELPAIYINGLLGTLNYYPKEGLDENRTVNREIFDYSKLKESLDNQKSQMGVVFRKVMKLLKIRSKEELFDPDYPPIIPLYLANNSIIATKLTSPQKNKSLYTVVNVSSKTQEAKLTIQSEKLTDLISRKEFITKNGNLDISLSPYQTLWLK